MTGFIFGIGLALGWTVFETIYGAVKLQMTKVENDDEQAS